MLGFNGTMPLALASATVIGPGRGAKIDGLALGLGCVISGLLVGTLGHPPITPASPAQPAAASTRLPL
jgi:hypothetical protein